MKSWTEYCKAALNRRFLIPVAAAAMVLSLTAYEFEKPVRRQRRSPHRRQRPLHSTTTA